MNSLPPSPTNPVDPPMLPGPMPPGSEGALYNPEILSLIIDIAIAALPICVALAGMNALYRFFSRDEG